LNSFSVPVDQNPWVTRTQNAAIFAACANLFSTALANIGMGVFLGLFIWVCLSPARQELAWKAFPKMLLVALGIYLAWRIVGLAYTVAPLGYAWTSLYSDRKILWVLPLLLVFTTEAPRRRFLAAFLATCTVSLLISYVLAIPGMLPKTGIDPTTVLRSHATQGMAFAMAAFLSLWFATQAERPAVRTALQVLAVLFTVNILAVTFGRSGYLAFLVFLVAAFARRGGAKGVIVGVIVASVGAVAAFQLSSSVRDRVMMGVNEARNYQSTPAETSFGRRMLLLDVSLGMIQAHPVLGTGTGSYKKVFSDIVAKRHTGWMARPFDDPHNQYLFALAENGVIGLATLLFLLWTLWRCCDRRHIYGQMAAGCLLAWCATSLFSGHFRTFPEGHLIAFTLGMLMMPMRERTTAVASGSTDTRSAYA